MSDAELITTRDVNEDGRVVRVLTFARPEQRNPIDSQTVRVLHACLEEADRDPAVRALIITGAGESFSAGGDLRGYQTLYRDVPGFRAFLQTFAAACELLEVGDFASIAMVNGACVAGGLEVALACDLMVAANEARIGDGHLNFGQLPGAGGSQRLCRAIGLQKAKELLLTGNLIDGAEAAAIGLASRAVPRAELEASCIELAQATARHSPLALKQMKALVALSQTTHRDAGLNAEIELVVDYATGSHDAFEGLEAFAARRPPRWLGR